MDKIECERALVALYRYLDNEIEVEHRSTISLHIGECQDCGSVFDFEVVLRNVVRARLRCEPPAELMVRIVAAIEAERLAR